MLLQNPLSIFATALATAWAGYLLVGKRGRRAGDGALVIGIVAASLLETFDNLALYRPEELLFWKRSGLLAESLFPVAWLLFSLRFARQDRLRDQPLLPRILLFLAPLFILLPILIPVEKFFYSPDFGKERLLFLSRTGYFFSLGIILYLTVTLVQFERTLTALPRAARWRGKFELIGAGALLATYLVYTGQGLLYRTQDMNLMPVRSLALILAIGLMAYSRLCRGETMRIKISRELAFRSLVVLVVGAYLLSLGLLGEGIRFLAPVPQKLLLSSAALAGGLAVVVFFLSETARRKIRVLLHKNFYQDKYDYREQWMRFTRQLSSVRSQEELHQSIPAFFAETFGVAGALLFLRETDGGDYRSVAACGLMAHDGEKFPPEAQLVRRISQDGWVYAARDRDPEVLEESTDFLKRHNISFVVPLQFDERLEGFVVLGAAIDPAEVPSYEDFDLMKMLARHAASILLNLRLADQLARAREMGAIGKIAAFILHDLKNHVSRLALVVENAHESLEVPEFRRDMLITLGDSVVEVKRMVTRLSELREKAALDLRRGDLGQAVADGIRLAGAKVKVQGGPVEAFFDPEELKKVTLNLILNAIEAGAEETVQVDVGGDGGRVFFRVRDRGCGMGDEFIRQRLFHPFQTTKDHGYGIGLYHCRHIIEAHGGHIEVESAPGTGSVFTVWLPGPGETAPAEEEVPVYGHGRIDSPLVCD